MEREQQTRLLDEQGKKDARGLWEEIFQEDTKMFLDYYDRWKLPENECFGIYGEDGRLDSMVQLNPYRLRVKGREAESRYIIAVATRPERRQKGLMRRLLKESLEYMRRKAMPFAFLMPASDAIYRPFDFRYFYTMNTGVIGREEPRGTLRAAEASPASQRAKAGLSPWSVMVRNTAAASIMMESMAGCRPQNPCMFFILPSLFPKWAVDFSNAIRYDKPDPFPYIG